ncbi:MAG: transglycosylase domain-containing protein [Methylocystaceae bacterium]
MKRFLLIICMIMTGFFVSGCNSFTPPEMSVIYDTDGRAITGIHQENRLDIKLKDISPYMSKAVVAAEDQHFYKHHGIDIVGIGRAAYRNIQSRRIVEGGSTITQQAAKNLYVGQERTWTRKLRELYYAILLERHYSKNEILELYLNTIYFGEGAYGVESAARTYFNKNAADLNLSESALLAGIIQRPSAYNPYKNETAAFKRQDYVLKRMVATGAISISEAAQAAKVKIKLERGKSASSNAPYFAAMVADYVTKTYGERMVYQGGLHVYTTLDLDLQKAAQAAYERGLRNYPDDLQGALIAVEPGSGKIRALIGGRDYRKYPFNRAVKSRRQPGSAFKPFLYSLALQDNNTEATTLVCEEISYPQDDGSEYRPVDYGDVPYHNRAFTLWEALATSDNVVAVRLMAQTKPERVAQYAKSFGFKGPLRPYYSLALGSSEVSPLELAAAYAVFAAQGEYTSPYYIEKIEDRTGRIIFQAEVEPEKVVRPAYAYLMTDMMTAVFKPGGTASHLASQISFTAAGKTGTTQEVRDAWFAGFTPNLSCAVWIGYDQPNRSVNVAGGRIAGPIWAEFMQKSAKKIGAPGFKVPSEVDQAEICLDSGGLATEYCERVANMSFIRNTEPTVPCWIHSPGFWQLLPGQQPNKNNPNNNPRSPRNWLWKFFGR